jgi:hypothetical protein
MPCNVKIDFSNIELNEVPDKYPACGRYVNFGQPIPRLHGNCLIIECVCPSDACKAPILLNYKLLSYGVIESKKAHLRNIFILDGSKIKCMYGNEKTILEISEKFVEIYNQAQQAELSGLDLICGAGYRKAFEYLIKDYVSKDKPDDAEKIKDMSVSSVIEKYITCSDLKEMAKRAIWLGNDETHIVRKWEEKDLDDLKKLIDITVITIKRNEQIKSYNQDMPNKK